MQTLINIGLTIWTNLPHILGAVLMILGGFSILAKYTPTQVDDEIIQKLVDLIHKLGLTK